jgi:hypothetical protein
VENKEKNEVEIHKKQREKQRENKRNIYRKLTGK